jgi:hypothetical protein
VAFTLAIVTLGPEAEAWLSAESSRDPGLAPWLDIFAAAALEESTRFVLSLIMEEAGREGCSLSPLHLLVELAALKTALGRLPGGKIGVSLAGGRLEPAHSAAFCVSWLLKGRSRSERPSIS